MRLRKRSTDWSTARRSCRETWMSNRRPTSSCRASSKLCVVRSGKQQKQKRKGLKIKHRHCQSQSSNILCHPGVRAPLPRCSTLCTTMMTTTMTSALMGRRTSAHHRATSAPQVRTTSCPPSLCKRNLRTRIKLLYSHDCWTKRRGHPCHMLLYRTVDITTKHPFK